MLQALHEWIRTLRGLRHLLLLLQLHPLLCAGQPFFSCCCCPCWRLQCSRTLWCWPIRLRCCMLCSLLLSRCRTGTVLGTQVVLQGLLAVLLLLLVWRMPGLWYAEPERHADISRCVLTVLQELCWAGAAASIPAADSAAQDIDKNRHKEGAVASAACASLGGVLYTANCSILHVRV